MDIANELFEPTPWHLFAGACSTVLLPLPAAVIGTDHDRNAQKGALLNRWSPRLYTIVYSWLPEFFVKGKK